MLQTDAYLWMFLQSWEFSHKQEKIAIARQLKRAHINKEKEEIEKQFAEKIKQLEEDRETLQKKRDVADQETSPIIVVEIWFLRSMIIFTTTRLSILNRVVYPYAEMII